MNKRMKALMVLGVVALLVGVFNFTPLIRNTPLKDVFTIGFTGVAYAAAPDYPVDGVDDDVQVQAALDALPTRGGKIVLYGGNYTFSATVARAIANVTIEGSGLSTYIVHDGSTPLFDDGGQEGWVFQFISVDAGGITRTGTGSIMGCWIDSTYIDETYLMKTDVFAGDVTGTYDATVVVADSHAHTGTTLSGIDISDDTNLAATAPVTLTGDTVGIGNATTSVLGVASFSSTDFAVSSGAVTLSHQRNIVLMAGSGWSTTTSGCAYSTLVESTTNKQNIWYADFSNETEEYIEWSLMLPNDFATDGTATMTAQFIWTAASGAGNVTWGCKWISYGGNETIDAAYGSNQTVNKAFDTANNVHITSATSAITGGGTSPAAGEFAQVRVFRYVAEAGDTLTADARLMSVILTYHGK